MTFCFYVKVKVGKLLANLVSMLVPDREQRHRVRRRLDPLSPERCIAYLERHYTEVTAVEDATESTMDHVIWVCWLQGLEKAPDVVQRCVASIAQYKRPEQRVVVLTAQNFSEYVSLPDVMVDKWRRGMITNTHFSDLLRIYALARHGGLWMDATCLLLAPLPEEVTAGPLYIMRSHGEFDYTVIQSCVMASDRNGYVMRKWCAAMEAYWQHENGLVNYFTLHLMFVALLHRDERFAADFARVPVVSDEGMHVLLDALSQDCPLTAQLMERARRASFVQKLTYKRRLNLQPVGSEPLISIIVPVYNGERYLRPCLDGILAQRYRHWELLLVDDGSTDGSAAICDEYAARDGRIDVVHKRNGGQALARNEALERARGEFISFIDCDDWLEPDMYERMMTAMVGEDADVVVCGYTEEFVGRRKVVNGDGGLRCYDGEVALRMVLEGRIGSYLWSMLFRRTVVRERMPLMSLYEDHATIFKWISHARRVATLGVPLYHYRQRRSSSLHGRGLEDNFYLRAIKERYDYVTAHGLLPGWEAENRRLLLGGLIKHAKDLARLPQLDDRVRGFIVEVRDVIVSLRPIRRKEVGTKYWLRLGLLLADVDWFVRILRLTAAFSLKSKKRGHQLYP